MIEAPFTLDQVESLKAYQNSNKFHPFTGESSVGKVNLIPTVDGWIAEINGPIIQTWCHHWMSDWSWNK